LVIRLTFQINGLHHLLLDFSLCDCSYCNRRQVTLEEATAKAVQLDIMFMETSAKAGHNVKSLFKKIAMSLPGMEREGQTDGQNASTFLLLSSLNWY
jgi:hypothetical protein